MRRLCISSLLLFVTAFACQREPAAREGAAGPAPGPAGTEAVARPAAAGASAYTVRIVPGEATAGQPATSVIEVSPAPGFKINQEFPAKLKLSKTEGVAPVKTELGLDDAEISDKSLRFSVRFTPANAGKVALAGAADFSVCNDTTCKLIRDEQLSWEVQVK